MGIVTSLQAAALRDVLTCLARRAPYVAGVVYPVPVQGAGAGQRIAAMLRTVSGRAEVDVVLLVRGGGSIEDLWAFNEEAVARAIRSSALPVVVGVGHESDITIADFAADLRAPTPTAAAEVVAPARDALLGEVAGRMQPLKRWSRRISSTALRSDSTTRSARSRRRGRRWPRSMRRVGSLHARLQSAANRAVAGRRLVLGRHRETLLRLRLTAARGAPAAVFGRLVTLVVARRHAAAMRLAALSARLDALDPDAVLKRGYAMAMSADGGDRHGCRAAVDRATR